MKRTKTALATTAALLALPMLAACSTDNFKDVKGVKNVHPDYVLNVENMDRHPNIGFLCIAGVPILTTTRSYNAITIMPANASYAWKLCATKVGVHIK